MKKVCWLLIFVLVLGCFAGCQRKPEVYGETLTKRQKAKIEEALRKEFTCAIEWHDQKNYGNVRYYGGFGEYAVIFIDTNSGPDVPYTLKIGRWSFYHPPGIFHLLMYKDGTFIHLKDAYEQGIVDDDMIASVKERHLNAEKFKN